MGLYFLSGELTVISCSLSQVNGVDVAGLRHSEVVALIRAGGDEVRLLVVDQETDEYFHRMGIAASTSHVKGQAVHAERARHKSFPPPPPSLLMLRCLLIFSQRSM